MSLHLGEHILTSSEKHLIDLMSVATVVGTLNEILPEVAALFTIAWTGIRIYETETIQKVFGRKPKE